MSRTSSRFGPSSRALLLFVGLSLFFFWPLWAPNSADHMTIGAHDDDFVRQFYPYRAHVARTWASGQVPLWNPHQYAGTPSLADPQQAVVYPWRAAQVPLAIGGQTIPLWSVELEAALHLALAGWFTYMLLRRLRAGQAGALFGGITFAFGGYLTGYPVVQLAVLDTAAWVPAVLLALTSAMDAAEGNARRLTIRWSLAAAVASAMMLLAGHPQTAAYGLAVSVAWWLWRLAIGRSARRLKLLSGLVWLSMSVGFSAVQWYPSWVTTGRMAERFDPKDLLAGLQAVDVFQLLVPGVITQWSPLFVGSVALVLVLWGLFKCRETWFWVTVAVLSWVVSLGGHSPVLPLLLRVVPGLDMFRHHERVAVVFSLALAVAAGLALSRLLAAERRHQLQAAAMLLTVSAVTFFAATVGTARSGVLETLLAATEDAPWRGNPADTLTITSLVLAMAGVFVFLLVRGRLSTKATAAALVAIALFELFSVNQVRALSPAEPERADVILEALEPRKRDGRVSSEALLHDGPNAASLHGLYDTTGDSPIRLRRYDELLADTIEMTRWSLLGVRLAVSDRAFPSDDMVSEIARDGERALYETQVAAPMSWVLPSVDEEWLCGTTQSEANAEAATAFGYDPGGMVWLSRGAIGDTSVGEATLVGLEPGRLSVEALLHEPSSIVVSTIYDPGWRVSGHSLDDGREIPLEPCSGNGVVPAYGSLMAVHVLEPGRWFVEWTYRPVEVIVGLLISLISLLLGVVLWRPSWTRRRP